MAWRKAGSRGVSLTDCPLLLPQTLQCFKTKDWLCLSGCWSHWQQINKPRKQQCSWMWAILPASFREAPSWSFLVGLKSLTADTKRSWAQRLCALHWGLLKQTAIWPMHTRSISSVSLIMLCFPARENLNFQMLSATSQGYLNNSDKVKHPCLFF